MARRQVTIFINGQEVAGSIKNIQREMAVLNKFLRENGLMETAYHTLYSLRHSFEDRMLAAGIDDRIRRHLFGHRLDRERYGKGATLEHKQELLQAAVAL